MVRVKHTVHKRLMRISAESVSSSSKKSRLLFECTDHERVIYNPNYLGFLKNTIFYPVLSFVKQLRIWLSCVVLLGSNNKLSELFELKKHLYIMGDHDDS